jgi:hypothetical protein
MCFDEEIGGTYMSGGLKAVLFVPCDLQPLPVGYTKEDEG